MAEPYFRPLLSSTEVMQREMSRHDVEAASREAAEREQALLRSLGTPRLPKPVLQVKVPELSDDFEQQVAALDAKIMSRGVGVDSEKLIALGKQRFQQLLMLDRRAPRQAVGAGLDLSRWESVQQSLGAFQASNVAPRKIRDQVSGAGKERDLVRGIQSIDDLWKCTSQRQETVDDILAFYDAFCSLVLAQSMLEQLSSDGRLRSRFCCGGKGQRVDLLLHDWQSVLAGEHVIVKLSQPLWHLIAWLADETTPAPSPVVVARAFFGVRSPSKAQLRIAEAVIDGFALDFDGWLLWQFVGRATRSLIDESRLSSWRAEVSTRYPRVSAWHSEVRSTFMREIDSGTVYEHHHALDAAGYRRFIDATTQRLLNCAGALLALGIDEVFSGSVVARFQNCVLLEAGKRKPHEKRTTVARQLAAAFPSASFNLEFDELQP